MTDFICKECEKECRPTIMDFGIGSYEFWGQRGVDRDEQVVSDCCEAPVLENGTWEMSVADYDDRFRPEPEWEHPDNLR